jgi:hypothetical protein
MVTIGFILSEALFSEAPTNSKKEIILDRVNKFNTMTNSLRNCPLYKQELLPS